MGLAQGRQIFGDGFFGIESQILGVGAYETFVENAAGKNVETLLFDGLQHARADFGDVGNVVKGDAAALALFAKFFSECSHKQPHRVDQEFAPQLRWHHHRTTDATVPQPFVRTKSLLQIGIVMTAKPPSVRRMPQGNDP